ncbi:cytosolic 5'-nucleotidase 1A-like [Arapaima gigas]
MSAASPVRGDGAQAIVSKWTSDKKPLLPKPEKAVTVAVSPRVLFNMATEEQESEEQPFKPGVAFPFVKGLMVVNAALRELDDVELFDIILVTSDPTHVGIRLINSINHYDLVTDRLYLTEEISLVDHLKAWQTKLYLSENPERVREAIAEGIPAATMFPEQRTNELNDTPLRVAFDGDAVIFSDQAEIVTQTQGLDDFFQHEAQHQDIPLPQGPLNSFLEVLWNLQKKFHNSGADCPIHTYLVTSRGIARSGARALNTLRSWDVQFDSFFFLGGAPKGPTLQRIHPHIFFDDQRFHITQALELGIIAAHVPYGVNNTTPQRPTE